MEQLLIQKPDNPIGFIVEYLVKKYPDRTKDTTSMLIKSASGLLGERGPGASSSAATLHTAAPPSDDESSSSSDEDDYSDHLEISKAGKGKGGGNRRASVSAESYSANAAPRELKKVPKTEQQSARILDILKQNLMFKHLDEAQATQLKDAMFSVEKVTGDTIIEQGEEGDNFYVIDEGNIDVFIQKDGESKVIKSMGPGESFGELALMYSTPRTATCRASSEVLRLWALDRHSFKAILMQTTTARRNQYKGFLSKVPILDQLTEYEILTIADALTEEVFEEGQVVCTQGDPGDSFYIIKEGTAVCSQVDAVGACIEVARLESGSYFGEIALMTSKPRQATVRAHGGKLQLLSLDRTTFKRVMGPMEEILKRNMEAYNKIAAANLL